MNVEPVHIISLGAGVQSSTMALMAAHGEITPMPKCAIFADTQDEPEEVYYWLDKLEKLLPFPVHRVTAGKLSKWLTNPYFSKKNKKMTIGGFPAFAKFPNRENGEKQETGNIHRQCTSNFKVMPIDKEITKQMRESGVKRAIKWIGISLDEAHRMKPSRRSTVEHRWPLVDARIKRHDCLLWMRVHGYPKPPRSACIYCPYHSNYEWRQLSDRSFLEAEQFEKNVQATYAKIGSDFVPFLHRSCVPLREVDFSTDEDHGQQVMFGNECEGMCGV
jgi:hypothetical protein